MTDLEQRILAILQQGLPDGLSPYRDMAQQLGVETEVLLTVLRRWKSEGKIRRLGAVMNHRRVGHQGGAMVVWRVPPDRAEVVGPQLARFPEVSHAYQRRVTPTWTYNLYTMVHAHDPGDIPAIIACMSQACGIDDYRVLETVKELKKTPPVYVTESQVQRGDLS